MARARQPTCYITYSHEDMDHEVLDYFVWMFSDIAEGSVRLIYDKQQLGIGGDIEDFEKLLDQVDVVLFALTPSYKRKISHRENCGVYREYLRIKTRYDNLKEEYIKKSSRESASRKLFLVPIVFSGDKGSSVPDLLDNILIETSFSSLTPRKNSKGKFIIPDSFKSSYVSTLHDIVNDVLRIFCRNKDNYPEVYHALYDKLFLSTKEDLLDRTRIEDFNEHIFLETHAYRKVRNKHVYFVIGRKGSGKSAITIKFHDTDTYDYNTIIHVSADKLFLGTEFHYFSNANIQSTFESDRSFADISAQVPLHKVFKLAWELFFRLCCMERLVSLKHNGRLTDDQCKCMGPIENFISEFKGDNDSENIHGAFYAYAFGRLREFIEEKCIQEGSDHKGAAKYFSDILRNFNAKAYFQYALNEAVCRALQEIVEGCKKRVLVTLDNFDSDFDKFRDDATDIHDFRKRSAFDTDWLRALLLLVFDVKDRGYGCEGWNNFFKTFDFCMTIPHDRFREIESTEKDGVKYGSRACALQWSGVELCAMLRKRLEYLTGRNTDSKKEPHERLNSILREEYGALPRDVTFRFGDNEIRVPLFIYILRHTFWRPREILLYFADILSVYEIMGEYRSNISSATVRRVVSERTEHIIRTEFYDEYDNSLRRIPDVIRSFIGCDAMIDLAEIEERLRNVPFYFAHGDPTGQVTLFEKIKFLYDIGFLGLRLDSAICDTLMLSHSDVFSFMEGEKPFRLAKDRDFSGCPFIIHPIFTEELQLNHSKSGFLLNYNWSYLYEHDVSTVAAMTR